MFIGRTDAKAEALVLWLYHVKSQLIEKDPGAGKDSRQKEKGAQRMRRLDIITDPGDMNFSQFQR